MDQAEKQNKIAAFAMEGMLYEVTATPKPGLVDRANNGAHYDMDYLRSCPQRRHFVRL